MPIAFQIRKVVIVGDLERALQRARSHELGLAPPGVEEARVEERVGTSSRGGRASGQLDGTVRPLERAVRVAEEPEEEGRGRQARHPGVAPDPEARWTVGVCLERRDRRSRLLAAGMEFAEEAEARTRDGGLRPPACWGRPGGSASARISRPDLGRLVELRAVVVEAPRLRRTGKQLAGGRLRPR